MSFVRSFVLFIAFYFFACGHSFASEKTPDYFNYAVDNSRFTRKLHLILEMLDRVQDMKYDIQSEVNGHLASQLAIELEDARLELLERIKRCEEGISQNWGLIETETSAEQIRIYLHNIEMEEEAIDKCNLSFEYIDKLEQQHCPWVSKIIDR